jgi:hypothetical protein
MVVGYNNHSFDYLPISEHHHTGRAVKRIVGSGEGFDPSVYRLPRVILGEQVVEESSSVFEEVVPRFDGSLFLTLYRVTRTDRDC